MLCMVSANGTIKGGLAGATAESTAHKVWLVSQGLGDIAFAYPYSLILLEIQVIKVISFVFGQDVRKY